MTDIKINKLATKGSILTSDLMAIADKNGIAYKADTQMLQTFFNSIGVSSYKGVVATSDSAPTEDGIYLCSTSGTYTNYGSTIVNLSNGITFISVEDTQTVFKTSVIDAIQIEDGIVSGSQKLAKSGDVLSYFRTNLDDTYNCFTRNLSTETFNVYDIAHSTATFNDIFKAFKSIQIMGSDNIKNHKLSFIRKNQGASNDVNAIQIMREDTLGTWTVVFYMNVTDLTINTGGLTRVDYTQNDIRVIAQVDFNSLPDGLSVQLESDKYSDPVGFYIKNECIVTDLQSSDEVVLKSNLISGLGESIEAPMTQKAVNDFIIEKPIGENVFNKNRVRLGKSINSSSPYEILDYTANNVVLTPFYKIPKNCKRINYGGISATDTISVRFSEEASDTGLAARKVLSSIGGKYIDLDYELKEFNYVVFSVFRGAEASTPLLDDVWVVFEEYKKETPLYISPRKPIITFQMDARAITGDNMMSEYVSKLEEYGHFKSTYNLLPENFNDTYLSFYRDLQLKGNEIAIHTDTSYDLSPSSSLTDEQFKDAIRYYLNQMEDNGFDASGWVSYGGTLKSEFITILKNYVNWGQTLSNIGIDSPLNGVNTLTENNFSFRRVAMEYVNPTPSDDLIYLNLLKSAVDNCITNNGFLIFYAHSYKDATASYTLREEIFLPLLDYIKDYADNYDLDISKTTSELLNQYYSKRIAD